MLVHDATLLLLLLLGRVRRSGPHFKVFFWRLVPFPPASVQETNVPGSASERTTMACRRVALRGLVFRGVEVDTSTFRGVLSGSGGRDGRQSSGVTIDRSGLSLPANEVKRAPSMISGMRVKNLTPMEEHLASLILHRGGPLTVAEFMHDALTHHTYGYYTAKENVFGSRGDFVTSPDISQMFGEAMGIWAVATWQSLGCPAEFRLVELGPGRGTLMADLMRGTQCFRAFQDGLAEISLVEVSEVLREKQLEALRAVGEELVGCVKHYGSLEEISDGDMPTLYIAHEFLDALPVHQFVKRDGAWREVLVDVVDDVVDDGKEVDEIGNGNAFRLVVAPYDTFALTTILPARLRDLDEDTQGALEALEVSPAVNGLASDLARRIKTNGGAAILIDYGQDGPYESSLTAIKDHEFVDVLCEPGKVDLSAYVDFDAVRASCKREGVAMHGPVDQGVLLKALGIDQRLQALIAGNAGSESTTARLVDGYKRLVGDGEGEMGVRYKAVLLTNEDNTTPVGFPAINI